MMRCQSLLLLSTCSLLLSTCFAFIPSNHPALIAPHHQHESSYHKPDTTLYAKTLAKQTAKKKPFQRAKTPSKLNTRAKAPSKQAAKKKPFQRAKTPSKLNTRAKTPSKQAAKKKPFQRAKTPSKQVVMKKKPFQRAKTPSKQNTRAKTRSKQVAKKKTFRRANTPSKPLFPQVAVGPPLLLKVLTVGGTFTVTLAAALVLSLSYVNPSSSIGDFSSKATTTKVKKNMIGNRKPTKAPKEYIDVSDIQSQ